MIANSRIRQHVIKSKERIRAQTADRDKLRTELAAYAHAAWSGWMKYQLSKATVNEDGTWTIPAQSVERWTRQMTTDFYDLPESEKKSDFDEADEILAIVTK